MVEDRTRGHKMVGTGESTDLWQLPSAPLLYQQKVYLLQLCLVKKFKLFYFKLGLISISLTELKYKGQIE